MIRSRALSKDTAMHADLCSEQSGARSSAMGGAGGTAISPPSSAGFVFLRDLHLCHPRRHPDVGNHHAAASMLLSTLPATPSCGRMAAQRKAQLQPRPPSGSGLLFATLPRVAVHDLVACQPINIRRSMVVRRRNRVAKPDPSKEGPHGPPMTLGNMRGQGVCAVAVSLRSCRQASATWPAHLPAACVSLASFRGK